MNSLLAFCRLEFSYSVRRINFWLSYLLFAAVGFGFVSIMGNPKFPFVAVSSIFKVNAPLLVYISMAMTCLATTFIVSSLTGKAAIRDFRYLSYPVVFSFPIRRSSYIAGKFMGICLSNLLLFTAPVWGYALACHMPWIDRSACLPFSFATYAYAYGLVITINIFFLTALFFTLTLLTRNTMINWAAVALLYTTWYLGTRYGGGSDMYTLLDPYGFSGVIRTGGTVQGVYGWNRLVWMAAGVATLLYASLRFRFRYFQPVMNIRKRRPAGTQAAVAENMITAYPSVRQDFGKRFRYIAFRHQFYMELRQIFRSRYFYVFFLIALIFVYPIAKGVAEGDKGVGGTLFEISELLHASSHVVIVIMIAVFGGEVVWRDIERRAGSMTGCLPMPRHLLFGARTAAVFVVVLCMVTAMLVAGMIQMRREFSGELLVSVIYWYGYTAVGYAYYCVLSVAIQTFIDTKYRGYVIFAFMNFLPVQFSSLDISRNILVPGYIPPITYTDIIGCSQNFALFYVFTVYWLLFGLIIWRIGIESFPLTEGQTYKERYQRLIHSRVLRFPRSIHVMLILFLLLGIFIYCVA